VRNQSGGEIVVTFAMTTYQDEELAAKSVKALREIYP
jgi:hypothetical protein